MFFPEKISAVIALDRDTSFQYAYVHPYKDAGYSSRMSTAKSWAGKHHREDVIDNLPVKGFQIDQSVSRYGYFGKGNVVWKIKDPRGFSFDITSSNLHELLACCTVKDGVIQEECLYARDSGCNALVPVTSELFKETLNNTKLKAQAEQFSLKTLQPGDIVQLKDGASGMYLGKVHCVMQELEARRIVDKNLKYDHEYTNSYGWGRDDRSVLELPALKAARPYLVLVYGVDGKQDRLLLRSSVQVAALKSRPAEFDLAATIEHLNRSVKLRELYVDKAGWKTSLVQLCAEEPNLQHSLQEVQFSDVFSEEVHDGALALILKSEQQVVAHAGGQHALSFAPRTMTCSAKLGIAPPNSVLCCSRYVNPQSIYYYDAVTKLQRVLLSPDLQQVIGTLGGKILPGLDQLNVIEQFAQSIKQAADLDAQNKLCEDLYSMFTTQLKTMKFFKVVRT